jgi:NADPH:quinone reductase
MRAVQISRNGGPEVIEVQDHPAPEARAGELLVDVTAIGVNFRDVYEREGSYGGPPPRILGVEGAGTVVALGPGAEGFEPGARIAWTAAPGSYAEQVVVNAERAVPIPEGVTDEVAAAALLQGMTAHYLSHSTYPVQPGETALVHAAAGGVGQLLTQLVKLRGGRVLATTSTDEKAALARDLGADEVLGYDGFGPRVRELTRGAGADVVYDGIGVATFDESLASLRPRGFLVLYGAASGRVPPVDPLTLQDAGSLYLTRPSLQHYTATREELLERAGAVFGWIADGTLRVRIGATYPLEEARRAHEDLEGRRTTGSLVLLP